MKRFPRDATREVFTAGDLARFCDVDPKTIHNWVKKKALPHFRTPGRHLRFQRADVLDLLQKHGFPMPEALKSTGAST